MLLHLHLLTGQEESLVGRLLLTKRDWRRRAMNGLTFKEQNGIDHLVNLGLGLAMDNPIEIIGFSIEPFIYQMDQGLGSMVRRYNVSRLLG